MPTKINWFPGHMAKGLNKIMHTKNVDMFIEVLDARAINISSNPNLIATKKPILKIALKSDMAINNEQTKDSNLIIGSIKDREFKKRIMNKLYGLMYSKICEAKHKGLIMPTFHVMVVGLPNVGKTALINFLSSSKRLITKNLPGVTKKQSLQKINDNFYLYDTPGILTKNILDINDGYKLALLGVIKREILPLNEVIEFAYNIYVNKYKERLIDHYGISADNYISFLENIAKKYNFYTNQKRIDIHRTLNFIYDEIINCKICNVNYEN